jgi:hypothetical protein
MEENTQEIEIFYYYNDKGMELYTPNVEFAKIQANKYGTFKVFVKKN